MKKVLYIILPAALTIASAAGAWHWLRDNKIHNFRESGELYVFPGESADDVFSKIEKNNQPISIRSLQRAFKSKDVASNLQPGHYYLSEKNSSVYVARMLNNGWQSPVKLTLSGNLRIRSNIAKKISCQLLIDSAEVHKALCDNELLKEYGVTPTTVFSLLMPDTYEIYWTASVRDILDKQKEATDAFWTEDNISKVAKLGLTREKASILASIVSAESNHAPEQPKIAGVYLNRLKLGMPLQADPTVAFCFDYKLERILKRHLEVDSPYNTYKHTGLPPGPICVPTRSSLEAVLNPDFGGSWGNGNLYFCANADFSGTHSFAKTLRQHNSNAAAFQKELNRRAAEKRKSGQNKSCKKAGK